MTALTKSLLEASEAIKNVSTLLSNNDVEHSLSLLEKCSKKEQIHFMKKFLSHLRIK